MKKYLILLFSAVSMCLLLSGCADKDYRDFRQARPELINYFSENQGVLEETKD